MNQTLPALKPRLLIHPTASPPQAIYGLRVTAWPTNFLFDASRFPPGLFGENVDARMIPLTLAYAAPKRAAQLLSTGFVVAGSPSSICHCWAMRENVY